MKIVAVVLLLLLESCNALSRSERINSLLDDRIALLTPSNGKYHAKTFMDDKPVGTVPYSSYVLLGPDLASRVIAMSDAGSSSVDVLFEAGQNIERIASVGPGTTWDVQWASSSTPSVLLRIGGDLFIRCLATSGDNKIIARNVVDASAVGSVVYALIRRESRCAVQRVSASGAAHPVSVPCAAKIVAVKEDAVLLLQRSDLALTGPIAIDVRTGAQHLLSLPIGDTVLAVTPLRGSDALIVTAWDGKERVDGSMIETYYVWDLAHSTITKILQADHGEVIVERSVNLPSVPCNDLHPAS